MLCFIFYNGVFLKLIYHFPPSLQQIVQNILQPPGTGCRAMTDEYANEIASSSGRNSGLKHNSCPGSPRCYHTNTDKEYLG